MSLLLDLGKKLQFRLFRAPFGFGKPMSKEESDRAYQTGTWNFLDSIDELPNYMIVVGYLRYFSEELGRPARILDLGCGTGNIPELLQGRAWERYLGLDISQEAVKRASSKDLTNAEFRTGSFEDWSPDETFDFIISTGAIHYSADPSAVLMEYSKALSSDGKFIISLWRNGPNRAIWKKLERNFEVIQSSAVENQKGVSWDIKVLR